MPIRRQWLPATVIVAGLLTTIFAAWTVDGFLLRAETSDAALAADRATAAVRLALDRAATATRAFRAMYASDVVVTSEQFGRFAQTLATTQSASAVGFVRRVEAADRGSYEQGLAGEPQATLGIWEADDDSRPVRAPDRPVHFVVESALLPGGSQPPIGFDVASLLDQADVIRRALERFQLSITGEVPLAQLGGSGIVLFDPVVDRASRLIGVATASVTHDDLVRVAEQTSGVAEFTLSVGAAGTAPAVATGGGGAASPAPNAGLRPSGDTTRVFAFADRLITIAVNAPGIGARPWIDLLIVALGLSATAAAVAFLFNRTKSEELRIAERRLRAMLDGLGPIAFLLARDGTVMNANRAAATTFGRSEDEMVRQPFAGLVAANAEADQNRLHDAIAAATRGEDVRFDLKREGPDGRQVFDLWIRRKEMSSDLVASAVDVTDRYEAEETQRLLMRELDHRMKNTLQVIQAIIRRTATTQESIAKFEAALLGRVGAMSRAHDLLANERWQGADITAVIRQETEHLAGGRALVAQGPPFRLSPKAALSLALVIHELATNAVKYGSLSAADGKVEIKWEIERSVKEPRLVLRWQESQGPRVQPARRRGFGSLLIERSIAYELDGSAEIIYREEGLTCIIAAPLRTVRSFAQQHQSMLAAR